LVCGSPGEIANDLTKGGLALKGAFDWATIFDQTTVFQHMLEQRVIVWTAIAIWSNDQLRQRVAWCLYQILVINSSISSNTQTEDFVNYYDIFVRNAFGNYRDVLKEVAHSRYVQKWKSNYCCP
jgi:hypothetical protein